MKTGFIKVYMYLLTMPKSSSSSMLCTITSPKKTEKKRQIDCMALLKNVFNNNMAYFA